MNDNPRAMVLAAPMEDEMMNKATIITRVNIYRHDGTWAYAAWAGDEYDHDDTLDATTEAEARAEVLAMFPCAVVKRVEDIESASCRRPLSLEPTADELEVAEDWISLDEASVRADVARLGADEAARYQVQLAGACIADGDDRWGGLTVAALLTVFRARGWR